MDCKICGNEILSTSKNVKYCSRECYLKGSYLLKHKGKNIIKKKCYCGKEFETYKQAVKFCSTECSRGYNSVRSREVTKMKSASREDVQSICNSCENQYANKCLKVRHLGQVELSKFEFIKRYNETMYNCYVYECDNYVKEAGDIDEAN